MQPQTQYAWIDDLHIAYQVVGDGPLDLVLVPGWVSNVELAWEEPALARFLRRLASFSRLILFDKRGTGLSDRVGEAQLPTLEQRTEDVRAVMDATGSERAALFGISEGGSMSALFAATYPQRTVALITFGIFAKRVRSPDYPWAPTAEERQQRLELIEQEWGGAANLERLAPSVAGDPRFREWFAAYLRRSASPRAAQAISRMSTEIDIRRVLPAIRVPTLVLHRTGDLIADLEDGRYIAARIPGARFVELPGTDHLPWVGDADALLAEVEEFLTGSRPIHEPDRVLATVLYTDLVDSTQQAARMGDLRWRDRLDSHFALVRRELARFRGTEIKTLGDGFLASFDGPARAIRCACAIRDAAEATGIRIRAALHTGECEVLEGGDLGGIAVHIGAHVLAAAAPGEVLVSSTVKDLVAGSGIDFVDRGLQRLKGVLGEWRLFAVASI